MITLELIAERHSLAWTGGKESVWSLTMQSGLHSTGRIAKGVLRKGWQLQLESNIGGNCVYATNHMDVLVIPSWKTHYIEANSNGPD